MIYVTHICENLQQHYMLSKVNCNKSIFNHNVGLSPSKKIDLFALIKPSKNPEKCFLFHLTSSFRSQDI